MLHILNFKLKLQFKTKNKVQFITNEGSPKLNYPTLFLAKKNILHFLKLVSWYQRGSELFLTWTYVKTSVKKIIFQVWESIVQCTSTQTNSIQAVLSIPVTIRLEHPSNLSDVIMKLCTWVYNLVFLKTHQQHLSVSVNQTSTLKPTRF